MTLTVGKHTYGHERLRVEWPQADVRIGAFCSIAEDVTLMLGGNHACERGTTFPFGHVATGVFPVERDDLPRTRGDVVIGSDVWIGCHASIMGGVKIGDGAVVAAWAHVVSRVPPYAVVGGNPATVWCYRHPPDVVRRLRALRWWSWPDALILEVAPLLLGTDLAPLFAWAEANRVRYTLG